VAVYAACEVAVSDPVMLETLDLVQRWTYLVQQIAVVTLCVRAAAAVTRMPDELPA
jgi:hypothetical protein